MIISVSSDPLTAFAKWLDRCQCRKEHLRWLYTFLGKRSWNYGSARHSNRRSGSLRIPSCTCWKGGFAGGVQLGDEDNRCWKFRARETLVHDRHADLSKISEGERSKKILLDDQSHLLFAVETMHVFCMLHHYHWETRPTSVGAVIVRGRESGTHGGCEATFHVQLERKT